MEAGQGKGGGGVRGEGARKTGASGWGEEWTHSLTEPVLHRQRRGERGVRAGCVCVCECVCVWGWGRGGGGGGDRRTRRNITRKQKHVKDPDHSTKSSGGRLHLNTHTAYTYVALNEVTPQTSTRLNGVHKTCAETAVVFMSHQPCNNRRALPVHHFRGY